MTERNETPQDVALQSDDFNPDDFCGWCGQHIENCESKKSGQIYGEDCSS